MTHFTEDVSCKSNLGEANLEKGKLKGARLLWEDLLILKKKGLDRTRRYQLIAQYLVVLVLLSVSLKSFFVNPTNLEDNAHLEKLAHQFAIFYGIGIASLILYLIYVEIGWVKDSISVTVFFDFLMLILMFFFNVAFIMLLILASSSAGKYTWLSEYVGELNGYVMLALPVFAFYPFFLIIDHKIWQTGLFLSILIVFSYFAKSAFL